MFRVPKSIEAQFGKRLGQVFARLMNRIKGGKIPVEQAIREFGFSKGAEKYLETAIAKMVNGQRLGSAFSWRELAKRKKVLSRQIHNYLKNEMKASVGRRVSELVSENAFYIKTLPGEWADFATELAFEMTMQGKSSDEIEEELRSIVPERINRNLKTIARTESAKANAAIAQARAEDMGISCYIWHTCQDERVRPSHAKMEGVVCFWNDPPSPEGRGFYHPGNTYNCRCYAEPILDVTDLPTSFRAWRNDGVRKFTRKKMIRAEKEMRLF